MTNVSFHDFRRISSVGWVKKCLTRAWMWINWISPPIHLSIWQPSMAIFPLSRHCCISGPKSLSRYNFNYTWWTQRNPTDFGELTTAHQALFKTISVPIFLQWQIIYQLGKSSYLDSRIFSQILNSCSELFRIWSSKKDIQDVMRKMKYRVKIPNTDYLGCYLV